MAPSSLPSNILIVGATGVIGRYITSAILASKPRIPSLSSVSIFTSPATAADSAKQSLLSSWKSQGLSVITGDIGSAADLGAAYRDHRIDTVVSALGRNSIVEQIELLRLAEESGTVQWFLPSEYGTDIEYDETSPHEPPHQKKLQVRKYVSEHISRLKVTYVVTGPYADMFLGFKNRPAGGFDAQAKEAVLVGDGTDRIGFTTMPDVGVFVAAALAHPEASQNKTLKVQSFVVTPKDILAEFEKQTGAKFKVEYTPKDELRELEKKAWAENDSSATGFTLRRIWSDGKTLYNKTDNEALGVKPEDLETLEAVVKRNVAGEGW